MKASIKKLELKFITPGKTSRGILYSKPSWFFILKDKGITSIGECSVIPGLNPEYEENYEKKIFEVADQINQGDIPSLNQLCAFPSIRFGLETALINQSQEKAGILFPSPFTRGEKGININGLIWMGSKREMKSRIGEKLKSGFKVLKLKVGALDFGEELSLLKSIRNEYPPSDLEIRLDANGAFRADEALTKLEQLSEFHIHSLEQPIKAGQWETMAKICSKSPVPVALDEELIGIYTLPEKKKLIETISPSYIILKPGLLGGFEASQQWINIVAENQIGWWVTSALESNVGLNAIAQWTFTLNPTTVQGLGTGQVFSNNIGSPLDLKGPHLWYNPDASWNLENIIK
jgi:o-succinylbenzoate synthase